MTIIRQIRTNRFFRYCTITAVLLILALPVQTAEPDLAGEALRLYEAGQYGEAQLLLERLDALGQADGPGLYRLYYCQRVANDPRSNDTLQRSRTTLEAEHSAGVSLEAAFYLANVYRNVGRLTDAGQIAEEATARLETGVWPEQTSGNARFMAGKLYADQDQVQTAIEWYSTAIEPPEGVAPASAAYQEWACQYIVDQALRQQDYVLAEHYASILLETGEKSFDSLDQLAVLRSRVGRHAEAAELWRQAVLLDSPRSNRGNYLQSLSIQAATVEQLPETSPTGRAWNELGKEELEQVMLDQAGVVSEVMATVAETEKIKRKQRKQLQARLVEARPVFIRAVLEYGYQGYPVRETAFQAGFANLIFHERHWHLPEKK
jgi:tetratricopeptide (TPR) repeat protein